VRLALALTVAALAAIAAAPGAGATTECQGLPTCIDVPGPWVAVPAHGEALFLLQCPRRQGIAGGTDALASSADVHVTFDGLLGGPVAPGRTTGSFVLFRGVSGRHQLGLFEPRIGCVPSPNSGPQTTALVISPAGPPLDLAAANIPLAPGTVRHLTLGCPQGESLVDSWSATAFPNPVSPALAQAVRIRSSDHGGKVSVTIDPSETLPRTAHALVQVGVRCAK
jgi:hypothetical protein